MGVGVPGICAALLHDIIASTDCPVGEIHGEFGAEIARMVTGVTHWDDTGSYPFSAGQDTEPVHRLKLADRLHNMQTIEGLPRVAREPISRETLDVFVPLAARLDLPQISRQLRELALGTPGRAQEMAWEPELAYDRIIVAVDIENSTSRTDRIKAHLRQALYELLERALQASGLGSGDQDPFLDRGDGVLTLIHPVDPALRTRLALRAANELGRLLARHNAHHPGHSFRLRMVVHSGEVFYDRQGCFSHALDLAFRLLDAPQLKDALRWTTAPLVVVISDGIYHCVARHGHEANGSQDFLARVFTEISGQRHCGWVREVHAAPSPEAS